MWQQMNNALLDATQRIIAGIARFLPGLLAMLMAVIGATILAWILRWAVQRALRGMNFDAKLTDWGFSDLADWSPQKSPTLLVGRAVAWIIIILGILVGLTALEANLTSRLALQAFEYIPNLAAALLILILGTLFARFVARGVLISAVNMQIQAARLLSIGVKWLVMVLTAAMALNQLRIGGEIVELAFAIILGGIVLALALAVGLGSKEMVSRSLEKQTQEKQAEEEETFHHL
jgi:hypothetical protein